MDFISWYGCIDLRHEIDHVSSECCETRAGFCLVVRVLSDKKWIVSWCGNRPHDTVRQSPPRHLSFTDRRHSGHPLIWQSATVKQHLWRSTLGRVFQDHPLQAPSSGDLGQSRSAELPQARDFDLSKMTQWCPLIGTRHLRAQWSL